MKVSWRIDSWITNLLNMRSAIRAKIADLNEELTAYEQEVIDALLLEGIPEGKYSMVVMGNGDVYHVKFVIGAKGGRYLTVEEVNGGVFLATKEDNEPCHCGPMD